MFENLVKSATTPALIELLNAFEDGIQRVINIEIERGLNKERTLDGAVSKIKVDLYADIRTALRAVREDLAAAQERHVIHHRTHGDHS